MDQDFKTLFMYSCISSKWLCFEFCQVRKGLATLWRQYVILTKAFMYRKSLQTLPLSIIKHISNPDWEIKPLNALSNQISVVRWWYWPAWANQCTRARQMYSWGRWLFCKSKFHRRHPMPDCKLTLWIFINLFCLNSFNNICVHLCNTPCRVIV